MGRNKRKTRRSNKEKKAIKLHPEAECAFKTIQSHPAINGKAHPPRPLNNDGFEITCKMEVSLPNHARPEGVSQTGVKAWELITFHFPSTYPFNAPTILLRRDFSRLLPHINPLIGTDGQGHVLPCVYDGVLDDLMHEAGDGLYEILNHLSDWLRNAAADDLIDPDQGWEPIRRDHTFGAIVYDLPGLRDLIEEKAGARVFKCRIGELRHNTGQSYFVPEIDHQAPQSITSWLIQSSFITQDSPEAALHGSLMILVWPNASYIADQYMPESIRTLRDLFRRAEDYGCLEALKGVFVSLGLAIKQASLPRSVFPMPIVLCARRPHRLINDNHSIELIPYMAICHLEADRFPSAESMVRFSENSPVFPIGHRQALTGSLLRQMSGCTVTMEKGPVVHIGCGSLGSKMAVHLARAGHGPFKLVDNKTFSPHNMARHALIPIPEESMQPKTHLLAAEIKKFRTDAVPYYFDITTICREADGLKQVFPSDTRLIIETTGSNAVRELLADLPHKKLPGRVMHAGLYQGGQIGLMAIEGRDRNPNLSDLTVQFHDLRIDHKDIQFTFKASSDAMARQGTGQGCGSHTMVMPDTRISLYAAGMAERARQVLEGDAGDNGELWVGLLESNGMQVSWQLFESGQTEVLKVKATNEWEIRILKNAWDQIDKEAKEYREIETGGVLTGRIFLARRCITVSRVIEAPPDSVRSRCSFVLGTEGLVSKVKDINYKTGGYLNYIGTWHSHPRGGGASGVDQDCLDRMKKIRLGAPAVGLIWTPTGFKTIIDEGKLS